MPRFRAGAGALEPGEDVGVEADGNGAFDGAVEFPDDSLAPVRYFGDGRSKMPG
ncbi:MAG TPA: hypothetical protein VKP61_17770 [Candidatus Acidoferrum sp.]|nr:hypothetical protein [Candidatus Acidoferrum sp.]